jgi:uncharacterized protein YndB with AHSA1/START domain
MPVVKTEKDTENLRFEIITELDATPDRVWQMWADPRLLEQWWGPPTYPATFEQHELTEGGSVSYFMTGPEGDRHAGWWKVISADPPRHLVFEDGFADESGVPNPDMPKTVATVTIEPGESEGSPTTMTIQSSFESLEELEKLVEMGMVEGMTAAMNQIDALL